MSKKVLFENDVFKETLVDGKWLRYEQNPNASLTSQEEDLLSDMFTRGVFTPVASVSFWHNGDFICDYMFTDRDKQFSQLKTQKDLPVWIRSCNDVKDFFTMIAWIKSNKGHLVAQGRWGLFLIKAQEKMSIVMEAS